MGGNGVHNSPLVAAHVQRLSQPTDWAATSALAAVIAFDPAECMTFSHSVVIAWVERFSHMQSAHRSGSSIVPNRSLGVWQLWPGSGTAADFDADVSRVVARRAGRFPEPAGLPVPAPPVRGFGRARGCSAFGSGAGRASSVDRGDTGGRRECSVELLPVRDLAGEGLIAHLDVA